MQDDLLTIRFTGPALNTRSLPIYELGTALVAIQRIIHKSALFKEGRLDKGAHLQTREREEVALQIVSHRKGSDLWGLAPYLTNAAYGPIMQGLVVAGLSGVAAYVWKKVIRRDDPPKNQVLIVNIFPEIRSLTERIRNIGGVEGIELASPSMDDDKPLLLSSETQEYVRKIEHQLIPGNRCKISGYVMRLYPQSFRLDLEIAPNNYVRVTLSEQLFEKVRRLRMLEGRKIAFSGVPLYKLGDTGGKIDEFSAERVILPRKKTE